MAEFCEVYVRTPRKAKKLHVCYECGGSIHAGEEYVYHHGVFDGRGFGEKVCPDCNILINEVNKKLHPDDCCGLGELHEFIFNNNDKEMIKKYVAIKRKRGAKIFEWMEE